jgi:polyhydroxyalkanoate synthesis regulator phasin
MFTSEQLDLIQEMIDHAVQTAIDDLNWERDIEDAVQGAQSDTQHNVDMLSNTVDDIERRLSDVENGDD